MTEFRVEIYTPPYLQNNPTRPTDIVLSSTTLTADGNEFTVSFTAPGGNTACAVVLYHGGYVTHSLHMNHRMLFLDTTGYVVGATGQKLTATMPPNRNLAQPGPYVIYVTVRTSLTHDFFVPAGQEPQNIVSGLPCSPPERKILTQGNTTVWGRARLRAICHGLLKGKSVMQGGEGRMRISFKCRLLIAAGVHMAHGMEVSSNGALGFLPDLCQWSSHIAEIKDGGISIDHTKYQIPGWWYPFN